jgi:hypothetical protein
MEDYVAEDKIPVAKCLEDVAGCKLYVGLFAWRYGYVPAGYGLSITESEYRKAKAERIPTLIFLLDERAEWRECVDEGEKGTRPIDRLRNDLQTDNLVSFFHSPADLVEQCLAALVRHSSAAPALIAGGVPVLPPHFVARPEASISLKCRLLDRTEQAPGVLVVSALHGLGGVGKSTLVAHLARDAEVEKAFPGGVLWATLGQKPDLLPLLSRWLDTLGDRDTRPTTVEAASARLGDLLRDRACLLVVDDAWQACHVHPFLIGGTRCRALITTRDAVIAKAVHAGLHDLDVMTPDEAVALLAAKLRRPLTGTEREVAIQVAEAVGWLPLALELVAAQIADGVSWGDAQADLRDRVARLKTLEVPGADDVSDEISRKRLSLLSSLHLSLHGLPAERRKWFAWLGILPDDVTLTPEMTAVLWGTDGRAARDGLRFLHDKSLVQRAGELRNGTPTYRIHDLLHDLARRLLTAPASPADSHDLPGLGLTPAEAHARFLERYQAKTARGLWHTLPDDGYIHTHLGGHLEEAGREQELHRLLREESDDRRNGWYQACERLGQVASYLGDVDRAATMAERASPADAGVSAVAAPCRYALMRASLNSLAGNVPPELLAALVQHRVWSAAQGLAIARQAARGQPRADALAALLPHLPDALRDVALREAQEAAQEIDDQTLRQQALRRLDGHPPEPVSRRRDAENVEQAQLRRKAEARVALVQRLVQSCGTDEALEVVQALGEGHLMEPLRAEILITLAADRLRDGSLVDGLRLVSGLRDPNERVRGVAALAPRLPPCRLRDALRTVQAVGDGDARDEALLGLAPYLPEAMRRPIFAAVRELGDPSIRARALARLAPALSDPLLGEALAAALALPETGALDNPRAVALAGLGPYLSEPLAREALAAALALWENASPGRPRAAALAALGRQLAHLGRRDEYLQALTTMDDAEERAASLLGLAPDFLPESLYAQALQGARSIGDPQERLRVLTDLVPRLPEELLPEVLRAVRRFTSPEHRTRMLAALAPRLSDLQAGAYLQGSDNPVEKARTLAVLAPYLPEEGLSEALTEARQIAKPADRVKALAALAPRFSESLRGETLREALCLARTIQDPRERAGALDAVAARLSDPHAARREAAEAACAVADLGERVEALMDLAHHLTDLPRADALARATAAARDLDNAQRRVAAFHLLAAPLASLSPCALVSVWQETLRVLSRRSRRDLLGDLTALAPLLHALGGPTAVAEVVCAVEDVARWWP